MFVLLNIRHINKQTITLSLLMQVMIEEQRKHISITDHETYPLEVEMPRKITLFRVILARELGIDYEHSYHSDDD